MMHRVYSFNFNINFFLAKDTDGSFYIEREYIGEGSTYFNPTADFMPLGGSARYITSNTQHTIQKELFTHMKHVHDLIFDSEPAEDKPKPQKADVSDLADIVTKLNEQNMEVMKNMMQHNPYEKAIAETIIQRSKEVSVEQLAGEAQEYLELFIQQEYGALPKRLTIETSRSTKDITGIFHEKFETILKFVERNIPLMLVGPAGSGKNFTLEQISEALELEFYFSNAITQEYKLTGFIDANGHFHETQFYKAFTEGGLFFLDEMDASIPEVLIILNAAIANRYFDFPTGRVSAHPEFRVVSAANTIGTGADHLYVGRNQLDAATLDRFAVLEFNYDEEVERQLASSEDLYKFIVKLRKTIKKLDFRFIVSMRATINASKVDDILDEKTIIDTIILKGMSRDERDMIENAINGMGSNRFVQAM